MPSKLVAPDEAATANIKILIELMRSATEFKADTTQMAAVCGLTAAKNVPRKINTIIAPFGYEFKSGKIFLKDGCDGASTDENAATPTPKPKKRAAPKAKSAKKRKIEQEDDGDGVDGAKVEEQASEEDAVENGIET